MSTQRGQVQTLRQTRYPINVAGAATALRRGERFLGVRLLTLGFPRSATLVTTDAAGVLRTSPLSELDLAAWPQGITPLTAATGPARRTYPGDAPLEAAATAQATARVAEPVLAGA